MSLAPMSGWTYRKCCWLLLTVLCVSKEMRPMKLFSLGFRVVAHVPCYLSEAVMFLFSALSLYFHLIFIVTFPPCGYSNELCTRSLLGGKGPGDEAKT